MRLRELRLFHKMTQQNVADAIGVSLAVYSYYEREEREPSIATLIKLSKLFDVSVDCIVCNDSVSSAVSRLSDYEIQLVAASRSADDRAKQDAFLLLNEHPKSKKQFSKEQ